MVLSYKVKLPGYSLSRDDKVDDIGVGVGFLMLALYCFGFRSLGGFECQKAVFDQFQVLLLSSSTRAMSRGAHYSHCCRRILRGVDFLESGRKVPKCRPGLGFTLCFRQLYILCSRQNWPRPHPLH
jgi:hypothetical protein